MSLNFVLGPCGSGKTTYIIDEMLKLSAKGESVLIVVPDQIGMNTMKRVISRSENKGAFNMEVVGFKRLGYMLMDELGQQLPEVLEDFGKTMLIRKAAGEVRDELTLYGKSVDKLGFIDLAKSLMSETLQYDIDIEKLEAISENLLNSEDLEDKVLHDKISDMICIFKQFMKNMEGLEEEIVLSEDLMSVIASAISKSKIIKQSTVAFDGFTGFTPSQLKVVRAIYANAKNVYHGFTIDKSSASKSKVLEHELFYLTRSNIDELKSSWNLIKGNDDIQTVLLDGKYKKSVNIANIEENLFRYPYKSNELVDDNSVEILRFESIPSEVEGAARTIRKLISTGYRYRDIAICCGNLEGYERYFDDVMNRFEIPYQIDFKKPLVNNPYINAVLGFIDIVRTNFSFDSVFMVLKSGVFSDIQMDEIEQLENYCMKRNIRGLSAWKKEFAEDVEFTRKKFIEKITPFVDVTRSKKSTVASIVDSLITLIETLDLENNIEAKVEELIAIKEYSNAKNLEKAYFYVLEALEKMKKLLGTEKISLDEFLKILAVGVSDLSWVNIPLRLDSVIIGDITRSRYSNVKVMILVGATDNIIPSTGVSATIINDREKERLEAKGLKLAPTDKQNSFFEQFYLYSVLSVATDKLYVTYAMVNEVGETIRPAYIVGRLKNLLLGLTEKDYFNDEIYLETKNSLSYKLAGEIGKLRAIDVESILGFKNELEILAGIDERKLDILRSAVNYSNIPERLRDAALEYLKVKTLGLSVTEAEKFANCHYAHFLSYVLGLRERENGEVDSRQFGNIIHAAFDKVFAYARNEQDNNWEAVTTEDIKEIVSESVDNALIEDIGVSSIDELCGSDQYLRETINRVAVNSILNIKQNLIESGFKPKFTEKGINKQISTKDGILNIKGIIDRADIKVNSDDTIELRVVDYKTGKKTLKLNEVYDGLNLQLAIYAGVIKEIVEEAMGADVDVTGIYYCEIEDYYVSDKKAADSRQQLNGMDNENGAVEVVSGYARDKFGSIYKDILSGSIEKNPYIETKKASGNKEHELNSCRYCQYKSACRYDEKYGGNMRRRTTFSDNSAGLSDAMNAMRAAVGKEETTKESSLEVSGKED